MSWPPIASLAYISLQAYPGVQATLRQGGIRTRRKASEHMELIHPAQRQQPLEQRRAQDRLEGSARSADGKKPEEPVTLLPRFIWERWPSEFRSVE